MIDPAEYEQYYYGKIYGKRRARVVEINDPERRGRIKVENVEIYGKSESPWVMPNFPFYGGRDCGFFSVPPLGSLVWIEFEEGLVEYPIYTGGFFDLVDHHKTDGSPIEDSLEYQTEKSAAPAHARGDYDGSDFGDLKGRYGVPASSVEGQYGEVTILQTKTGHRLEFDDTEGGERVQLYHAKGAHIEILPDGTINIVSDANILTRSTNRKEIVKQRSERVVGSESEEIEGDSSTKVFGNQTSEVFGDVTYSSASVDATIEGFINVSGNALSATIDNLFEASVGGDLSLSSFGDFDILCSGKGFLNFSNSSLDITELINYEDPALFIKSVNGTLDIGAYGLLLSTPYGVRCTPSSPLGIPLTGGVYIGNFDNDSGKERVVMGDQLATLLSLTFNMLKTFFSSLSSGGITPGLGLPNPVLAASATAALTAIDTLGPAFGILPVHLPAPIPSPLLSDTVFVSKD